MENYFPDDGDEDNEKLVFFNFYLNSQSLHFLESKKYMYF